MTYLVALPRVIKVLHEEILDCAFINHLHPWDLVSSITYIKDLDENVTGDLEALTIRTIGKLPQMATTSSPYLTAAATFSGLMTCVCVPADLLCLTHPWPGLKNVDVFGDLRNKPLPLDLLTRKGLRTKQVGELYDTRHGLTIPLGERLPTSRLHPHASLMVYSMDGLDVPPALLQVEAICKTHVPHLSKKIVCVVDRRILRQSPKTEAFLL